MGEGASANQDEGERGTSAVQAVSPSGRIDSIHSNRENADTGAEPTARLVRDVDKSGAVRFTREGKPTVKKKRYILGFAKV